MRRVAYTCSMSGRSRHLLWDHDGVLVDTERWYFEATWQTLARIGVSLPKETGAVIQWGPVSMKNALSLGSWTTNAIEA